MSAAKKRFISVLSAVFVLLTLASCQTKPAEQISTPDTTQADVTVTAPAPETTAEPEIVLPGKLVLAVP